MHIVDLSLDVVTADSWIQFPRKLITGGAEPPTKIETLATIENNGVFVQGIATTNQCFTHIDAPRHFILDGAAIDEVPLDRFVGDAVVFDMLHKAPASFVTAADLESCRKDIRPGDIAIIRTGWTDRAWGTRRFWEQMICLAQDSADWLIAHGIKALAQDFMTDQPPVKACQHCGSLLPTEGPKDPGWSPNHFKFLGAGIPLIEWCTNMAALTKPRVTLIALPLKIKGADGSQARVIALEED